MNVKNKKRLGKLNEQEENYSQEKYTNHEMDYDLWDGVFVWWL